MNRYKGIYPYDQRRVILNEGYSDYINASYIDGYKKIKAYIASIGPTYKYMEDMSPFWRMVWQEKVGKIVMLTKLSEAGDNVAYLEPKLPTEDMPDSNMANAFVRRVQILFKTQYVSPGRLKTELTIMRLE
ncbi:receptor-type tyrosine-protein phosphatase epsilon-like [Mercenaria mercenaria]|uniref:receptor-type tyrosine-protein phosphatase epsilon-like n=1 Tax=Mercenaria mercenaria TaxID=6596 RepID=UPI00234F24B5|nr:receptor-type tyrosine-protein phosphatase epsilon-like [Mercenaria mercenaria]